MGTPEFAVSSLKILVENKCNIVGVITAPDKPKGRGKKLGISAVKEFALEQKLHILQPTNLKDAVFLSELEALKADLQVVVAFRMLPEVVWSMPPLGTFNLHASLLPNYRGAAPINWAIMNGETETGVTTFFLKHEIDTGSIIFQDNEPIHSEDTVGDLYSRLMIKGAGLVLKTVQMIAAGSVITTDQEERHDLKHAPKIFKENCKIDWNKEAQSVHNHIRGLSPYPAAWCEFHGKNMKVLRCEIIDKSIPAGTFESDGKSSIHVGTLTSALNLLEVQLEGKKRMKVDELLRGYRWPDSVTEQSKKKAQ